MLIAAAAARWNVPAAQCGARNSTITHAPSGRSVTFGAVAERRGKDRAAGRRQAESRRATGSSPARRASVSMCATKSRAQPVYAIDVRLPDMLYAAHRAMPGLSAARSNRSTRARSPA